MTFDDKMLENIIKTNGKIPKKYLEKIIENYSNDYEVMKYVLLEIKEQSNFGKRKVKLVSKIYSDYSIKDFIYHCKNSGVIISIGKIGGATNIEAVKKLIDIVKNYPCNIGKAIIKEIGFYSISHEPRLTEQTIEIFNDDHIRKLLVDKIGKNQALNQIVYSIIYTSKAVDTEFIERAYSQDKVIDIISNCNEKYTFQCEYIIEAIEKSILTYNIETVNYVADTLHKYEDSQIIYAVADSISKLLNDQNYNEIAIFNSEKTAELIKYYELPEIVGTITYLAKRDNSLATTAVEVYSNEDAKKLITKLDRTDKIKIISMIGNLIKYEVNPNNIIKFINTLSESEKLPQALLADYNYKKY